MGMKNREQSPGLEPAKLSILGKESIIIDHGLWLNYVAADLLHNVKADPNAPIKFALVTDTNLHDTYVPDFVAAFEAEKAKLAVKDELLIHVVAPGESTKSRDTVGQIHDWLANHSCTKDAVMIALGGGVIGDMVGYTAATYMRGITVVQVPTTLLSMVDSSIGGKTAIDTPYGKNLVGAFWQPKRIYIDLQFLFTLPKREFINGMGEIIKTAAIWNEEEFTALEKNRDVVMKYLNRAEANTKPDEEMTAIIKRMIFGSAKVKAHVVSEDEREGALRNLLNFGHSIGHAMEAILAPQILHGECIAIGMVKEAELSRYLGLMSDEAVARLTKCIASYGLPISLEDPTVRKRSANRKCPVDDLLRIMAVDKKNSGSQKRIVLLSKIGQTYEPKATPVPDKQIRFILSESVKVQHASQQPTSVTCIPPGSKSISNRAIVLAALGSGTCRIKNFLHSDDTHVMVEALTSMQAAEFYTEDEGQTLVVKGMGGSLKAPKQEVFLGNAGTAARFLTAVSALATPADADSVVLTGNSRMKERPIGPLVTALTANGSKIAYQESSGSLPIKVAASGGLEGGEISLAATISSQYVSAILMCAPYAKKAVTLRLVGGKPVSQPYIDMTLAMMESFGVKVTRSSTEEHTYHIPSQKYSNPKDYEIESDASSATYPLAIAAITGTTCVIPNIGSKSLQGDARFAVDVLKPMGCTVEQTKTSTTVTGPAPGKLQAIDTIDMENMTDSFLTTCILAAVAQTSQEKSTTRITGIANQRVKECDRIAAMRTELAKFGVCCLEQDGGIEVDGVALNLKAPAEQIYCYDDHRVAMSFSVLALAAQTPVIIQDKACVGKTWPGWWDTLSNVFQASLEGVDAPAAVVNGEKRSETYEKSIFLIGMRGAGKTTAGHWAASLMGWPMIDLDQELEKVNKISVRDFVTTKGWEEFRKEEARILQKTLKEKPYRHIFACGGGIVETPENRQLLTNYHKNGGIVLLIMRSIDNIIEYLNMDKSRPAYGEDIQAIWARRKPLYTECSNFQYYGSNFKLVGGTSGFAVPESGERERFNQLLSHVTSLSSPMDRVNAKTRSYFVSLTMPRFNEGVSRMIRAACVGSDAVEFRVDLLVDPNGKRHAVPTVDYMIEQAALLRTYVNLPLIYTIRTKSQAGQFPDDGAPEALILYRAAVRAGFEFIDLEMTWPTSLLEEISSNKGNSRIISSHHSLAGMSWKTGGWIPFYNRALQYGDIVKLIGFAHSLENNDELEGFRTWATKNSNTPLIALNMGERGQLSRVRNLYMSPVAHPALPFVAAPGQLSAKTIREARALIGINDRKQYYLFGTPISESRSPDLHNFLFQSSGLPHKYCRLETNSASDLKSIVRSSDFGGASVTIPLKVDIVPLLDETTEAASIIGAVNTIVVYNIPPFVEEGPNVRPRLRGYNTDWHGIRTSLRHARAIEPYAGQSSSSSGKVDSAMVIGGGGTSRAAIYALHVMGYSPIYLAGRSYPKLVEVADRFPKDYNIIVVTSAAAVKNLPVPPVTAVGTIPADKPIDESLRLLIETAFSLPAPEAGSPVRKVLLEMAYKPSVTELMKLAQSLGWITVPGLEALTAQGIKQFELWTRIEPLFEDARAAVLGEQN